MLEFLVPLEALLVVAIGCGSLLYALIEAAAYGTANEPWRVAAGILGYVAVWLYVFVRAAASHE
jgi:hypothetical protein